ncbi:stereocilin [Salarias fasciatus]|uniref:stereocilin n=1 Tax=Salarias fasciatus TaxID=181472 RepID=UPI001176FABC|nr:stereocilin-like [Salarias fasciatus]
MSCSRRGLSLPSQMILNFLMSGSAVGEPSSLTVDRLIALVPVMPSLGVTFLQNLTASQLHDVLPEITSTNFTPEQASLIVDKLASSDRLNPDELSQLGSLTVGVKTETLLTLMPDRLLPSLTALARHTPDLCSPLKHRLRPPQANAITTKLWGFPAVVHWLNDVEPLLSCTPLLSVRSRTRLLVNNTLNTSAKSWNTQQAKAIFNEMLENSPNRVRQDFLRLGSLGQGVSCTFLQEHLRAHPAPSSVRSVLKFLRQQPTLLHTSLKTCLIKELYKFEFLSDLVEDLGAEIALSMPVSKIKKFPNMDSLRRMIIEDPRHFLLLSRTKQELLVDKMVQRMAVYPGVFTEEEFRSLGVMASFVGDEIFIRVDRHFFIENLDLLRGLCYSYTKMELVARILQETAVFGPVRTWSQTTLSQVDRFLFFLPHDKLQEISQPLMTVGRIEKLFMSQRQWERGDVGMHCLDEKEREYLFSKQQFLLQFYLGFLKILPDSGPFMIPTCEILQTTAPSAWTPRSLYQMPAPAFSNCLELIGQDPFMASYQRVEVLKKVKQIYGPASSFSQAVISQLGGIATELSRDELGTLRLTDRRSIAAMGAVSSWSKDQLSPLFASVLKSTQQSPSQLDSSTLVSLGHIVCGASIAEMNTFNPIEFSKAALWLGRLRLSCSEEQLTALVELLAHPFAFGAMSSWDTDVFIEIGVLAAGLPDMAMSALVKEQIEGITPLAISTISKAKFSVAFDQAQISMFSYEQAAAVTKEQMDALTEVERTALAMVLTPWENRNVNFRGRSQGLALSHSPVCLVLGLLMLLSALLCPGT